VADFSYPPDPPADRGAVPAERRLACSVIELAWIDFLGFDRGLSNQARNWFLAEASSFPTWCDLAGLPPGSAQRIRFALLDTHPLWLDAARSQALGLAEPTARHAQRVHAVSGRRGRPRKTGS
jgi:hypothetical protein